MSAPVELPRIVRNPERETARWGPRCGRQPSSFRKARDGHQLTKRTTVCTENLDPCAQGRKAAAHDTHPQKSNSSKDRVDTMASAGSRVSGLLKDSYEAKVRIPNIRIRRPTV